MLKFNNVWLFVKNMVVILSTGRWPIWDELWRTSKAGDPLTRLAFKTQGAYNRVPQVIRETIDDCQLAIGTSGTAGMGYQVLIGHTEGDPNVRAAVYRVLAEIRLFHVSVDSLGLMLLEGAISQQQYYAKYLSAEMRDRQFKQTLVSKYPAIAKVKDDNTELHRYVKRILNGEDQSVIFDEFLASIWPDTKGYRNRLNA